MRTDLRTAAAVAVVLSCLLASAMAYEHLRVTDPAKHTPLDAYVARPDSHYNWHEIPGSSFSGPGYTGYVLNMTSQQWLNETYTAQSVWWHYQVMVIPNEVDYADTAFVYITGGSNHDGVPKSGEDIDLCLAIALTTHAPCVVLFQIPNEPIYFTAEKPPKGRSEDAIIAYTWNHFLDNPSEPDWLLRLPMTKASVRAMDTTTAFMKARFGKQVDKFIVGGASKRGWTTWTTAAVDKRVIAAVPIVMDALNLQKNVKHFWRAYGGWTFALKDYYVMNFTARLDDPNFPAMAAIIDPISYAERLTMPKLVIDATGDEFFMDDDNWFWWGELPGETHLLMVHNAEHSLATGLVEVVEGVSSFAHSVLGGFPRPEMTWNLTQNSTSGTIDLQLSEEPEEVIVRWADTLNHTRRDWRLIISPENCGYINIEGNCIQPVFWKGFAATQLSPTRYTVTMDNPDGGWRAFLMEVRFKADAGKIPYVFTTQVNIIPNVYPFPPCHGEGCRGTLL